MVTPSKTSFSNSSDGSCSVRYLVVSIYLSMISSNEKQLQYQCEKKWNHYIYIKIVVTFMLVCEVKIMFHADLNENYGDTYLHKAYKQFVFDAAVVTELVFVSWIKLH